jgi:4-hydroxy-tetrahydrodipicolinate reductase
MGSLVAKTIEDTEGLAFVGGTDLGEDLSRAIRAERADVVVDFTAPGSALSNTLAILDAGARPVVGTTGFLPADLERVRALCAESGLGAVIAPNFAIGAVLSMRFAREAARFFPTVEIVELHHDRKADAPSGTALRTAEAIAEGRGATSPPAAIPGEIEILAGARGALAAGRVRVHSVRLSGLVAHQEVIFGGEGETLTLRHDSLSRECFMPGVVLAVRRVPAMRTLVVGLESLLFP